MICLGIVCLELDGCLDSKGDTWRCIGFFGHFPLRRRVVLQRVNPDQVRGGRDEHRK